jgi:hypothetical protein
MAHWPGIAGVAAAVMMDNPVSIKARLHLIMWGVHARTNMCTGAFVDLSFSFFGFFFSDAGGSVVCCGPPPVS